MTDSPPSFGPTTSAESGVRSFIMRVWLGDTPGAFGAVATRIGAAGADLVGIEILESGGGLVIDELILRLPDGVGAADVVAAVDSLDRVSIEEFRLVDDDVVDAEAVVLAAATHICAQSSTEAVIAALMEQASMVVRATWVAFVSQDAVTTVGSAPTDEWITAFVRGRAHAGHHRSAIDADAAVFALQRTGGALVVGRDGMTLRDRELRRIEALAQISDNVCR
jgi:hypothetical protein